jgi:hypothetical protein
MADGQIVLIAGFPLEIPVEIGNLVDSKRFVYGDEEAAHYFVSYLTDKLQPEKYGEYLTYMGATGYHYQLETRAAEMGPLHGTRVSDDLLISITSRGEQKFSGPSGGFAQRYGLPRFVRFTSGRGQGDLHCGSR